VWEQRFGKEGRQAFELLQEVRGVDTAPPRDRRGGLAPALDGAILFATNRDDQGETRAITQRFGIARVPGAPLTCGLIDTERDPRRRFGDDFKDKFTLREDRVVRDLDACFDLIEKRVGSTETLFIFFHGYANTFADSLRRAAGFVQDTRPAASVLIWSWPSMRVTGGYNYDDDSVSFTEAYLERFADRLVASGLAPRTMVLAHGFGRRP
jgi:esterase/lipase superfamily enzyme